MDDTISADVRTTDLIHHLNYPGVVIFPSRCIPAVFEVTVDFLFWKLIPIFKVLSVRELEGRSSPGL